LHALQPRLGRIIATKAVHPRALEPDTILETADRLGIPAISAVPVAQALRQALEWSVQDGSLVLSAGSMFVTAEARAAWDKDRAKGIS
jgi:folylpolyglutamate synthase/dihydropteroate synthase